MPGKTALEKLPYRFLYSYRCADAACNGHRQSIIDWEIGAAFRDWRDEHGNEEAAIELIRQKWGEQMWQPKRDTFFYTGNRHDYPDGFLVLGVFWPEKVAVPGGYRVRRDKVDICGRITLRHPRCSCRGRRPFVCRNAGSIALPRTPREWI